MDHRRHVREPGTDFRSRALGVARTDQTIIDYSKEFPEEWRHLVNYGLLAGGTASPRITISVVRDWLRRQSTKPDKELETVFERFELVANVSRTEISEVWKGVDRISGEAVAVKIFLHSTTHAVSLAERETDVLNAIDSPRIVQILHYGLVNTGRPAIVLKWVDGSPLSELIEEGEAFAWDAALEIGFEILKALSEIHPNTSRAAELRSKTELTVDEFHELQMVDSGYIHRDIKPGNLIWNKNSRQITLIDFNISSKAGAQVATTSNTPGYIPPDYHLADPSQAWSPDVDLFAVGVVLYQLMSGAMPYASDDPFNPREVAGDGIPENVRRALLRSVAPRQRDRFDSAVDFIAALAETPQQSG